MSKNVADNAIQVHGGYGYCGEYQVEQLWRDAKLLEIGGGTLESHQKNRRWRLWRDLRGHRSGHQRTSGPQTRVGQAAQTGAQNGGGCPQEAAGPRTRLSIHWLWAQRPFQLRSDAIASQVKKVNASKVNQRLIEFVKTVGVEKEFMSLPKFTWVVCRQS